jgi:hypothetical protein
MTNGKAGGIFINERLEGAQNPEPPTATYFPFFAGQFFRQTEGSPPDPGPARQG